jgi:hypothetical protein
MSGGNAIYAAAIDKPIGAVIAQIPFVCGEFVSIALGLKKSQLVLADRTQLAEGYSSTMVLDAPESVEEAENDMAIPANLQLAMYQRAQESERCMWCAGRGILESTRAAFEENIKVQLDFPKEAL